MITIVLVLSGTWGMLERDSTGEFVGSAVLAAFEIAAEAALLVAVLT